MPSISFSESNILAALRSVLLTYGFEGNQPFPVVRGQINRVPEPRDDDFIVMWPILRSRISSNTNQHQDTKVFGSIKNNVLNVTSFVSDTIGHLPKQVKLGTYVSKAVDPTFGALIKAQNDGSQGGVGNYQLQNAPDAVNQIFYVGVNSIMQPMETVIQCDIHGPRSGDNAQILSTLFRDWSTVRAFRDQGYAIAPLYSDDPRQIPFINAENQWEERHIVDLHLQTNQIVNITQQYADQLQIETLAVETLTLL